MAEATVVQEVQESLTIIIDVIVITGNANTNLRSNMCIKVTKEYYSVTSGT